MNELTLFLAKMMAPYLLITGLGFLLSKKFYLQMLNESEKSDPVCINLSGMVHFFIGLAVVLSHTLWGSVLEIVVTLLGIAFMLKGAVLIMIPNIALKSNNTSVKVLPIMACGFIIMGAYLTYASYFFVEYTP